MSEKRKKFLPQSTENNVPKVAATKSSKAAFQARKIIENNFSTPAGSCISIREQFDNYIKVMYPNIDEERQKLAWVTISNQLLVESSSKLQELIHTHFN